MCLKLQLRSRQIVKVRVARSAFGCRLAAVPPATKTPTKPSVAAPERSLVQRMEALERANQIRTRRAQLKRDLKAGRASIHDLLRLRDEISHEIHLSLECIADGEEKDDRQQDRRTKARKP